MYRFNVTLKQYHKETHKGEYHYQCLCVHDLYNSSLNAFEMCVFHNRCEK